MYTYLECPSNSVQENNVVGIGGVGHMNVGSNLTFVLVGLDESLGGIPSAAIIRCSRGPMQQHNPQNGADMAIFMDTFRMHNPADWDRLPAEPSLSGVRKKAGSCKLF